jgi:acetyltransferase-like isoleucine patch superfamily enzyme
MIPPRTGSEPSRTSEIIVLERGSQRRSLATRAMVRLSSAWLRRRFGSCGRGSLVEWPLLVVGGSSIHLGIKVHLWYSARLEVVGPPSVTPCLAVGDETKIGPRVHLAVARRVEIGRGCLFASGVYITDHDHDFLDPAEPPVSNSRVVCLPTIIGDRVFLGERVIVLKGVTIGEGSVVGAGSVVTRSIPPFSIAVGSPARVIRRWDRDSRTWVRV